MGESLKSVTVSGTGLVYRNPSPHVKSRHAYFPSIVSMGGGKFVASMDIGEAFEAVNARSHVCHSDDNGKTWSVPVSVLNPDESKFKVSTTMRTSRLPDGSLMGWVTIFDRPDEELGLANPKTDGFVNTTFFTVRSTDGGKTWSKPAPVNMPNPWKTFETCAPVIAVNEKRWVVPTSPLTTFDGAKPTLPPGLLFASDDAGKTWQEPVVVFDHTPEEYTALEEKITQLSDGRWLAVCWTIDPRTGGPIANRYAIGDAEARQFSKAQTTGINGETNTVIALENNHVLSVYRRFDDKPGLWAQLARVDGDKWVAIADQQLWTGMIYDPSVTSKATANFMQMKDLRFGYPSLTRTPEGDVMIAFWCVEQCVFNIRWIRVKIA